MVPLLDMVDLRDCAFMGLGFWSMGCSGSREERSAAAGWLAAGAEKSSDMFDFVRLF
jgi:hypothetical protein